MQVLAQLQCSHKCETYLRDTGDAGKDGGYAAPVTHNQPQRPLLPAEQNKVLHAAPAAPRLFASLPLITFLPLLCLGLCCIDAWLSYFLFLADEVDDGKGRQNFNLDNNILGTSYNATTTRRRNWRSEGKTYPHYLSTPNFALF